ncbi:MAG: capsule assembly Wzi family protein [Candidatus Marinimicrobia bacterium]|nr:capsule assembly Wzi family protein [Candidatus Neomarinimicrobiota bacterium]
MWLLGIFSEALIASQGHVRLNDPIYLFLDRMATGGLLPGLLNDTRPYTRDKIAGQLAILNEKRNDLSGIDRTILDEYMADYRLELFPNKSHFQVGDQGNTFLFFRSFENIKTGLGNIFQYEDNCEKQHLFVHESDNEIIWIDWEEMLRVESKNGMFRPVTQDAIRFSAQLGDNFFVYFDGYRYVQFNMNSYTELTKEYKGGYSQEPSAETISFQSFDYSNAYIQISGKYGLFELGTEPLLWGNGPNSLILSDNVTPFPFFSWQKDFRRAQFSFFHGSLLPKEFERDMTTGEKIYAKKYLVGHRWDLAITEKFNFSFTELYIYGNRDMELMYLVPPVILWPTQHNLMDRDNATMALEFEYFPWRGSKFYGTLYLDEFTTTQIFNDYWANKQGLQLGLHYAPLKLPTDFRMEFTAVHPWTYSHKFSYSSYTHNGVDLGFYAGPNSQLWFFGNQWWPGKRLYVSLQYRHLKHGVEALSKDNPDYYPIGSNSNQKYNDRNENYDHNTKWLMGDIETANEYQVLVSYRWRKETVFDWGLIIRDIDGHRDSFLSFQTRFNY